MLAKVKFWKNVGWGFILINGQEAFIHHSEIISDETYKTLRNDQLVDVTEVCQGEKGLYCKGVKPINPDPIKETQYKEEE